MSSTIGQADKLPSLTSAQPCFRFFLAEIQSATKDFDDELVIGQGGFGKVYKGCICIQETSHVVAIKRLDSKSNQGAPEFKAEIEMLSKLRHCHLVSLIGFCDDNDEMILVYVYMPHGTLYNHLHKAETPLNWEQRLKIAIGAGRGLDYLHTGVGTKHGVIHRDVKTSNILLDENWGAMISDFGLSKLGPTDQSWSYVDASVKGTFGYLDPEYFYTRKLTRKTDVYAFGVVLFELLSGRLAVDERNGEDNCSLVRWAQRCVKERNLNQMVDSNIRGTIFPKCLRGFVQIAHRFLHSVVKERPTMAEVVISLQALLELQQRYANPIERSGITGFTWMIHKYLVSVIKRKDDLKCFTYNELRSAMDNFGEGKGFINFKDGNRYVKAYKGWIDRTTYSPSKVNTGLVIAVKRIYKPVNQMDLDKLKEFSHPNLEKLIGYCLEGQLGKQLFLVYEFMPNGNFKDLLDSRQVARLPLVTKVKIALGIARGIVFLNKTQDQDGRVSEYRLDRHNILLDEDFTAKLSGYDVLKLVFGRYQRSIQPSKDLQKTDYAPWVVLSQLQTNLSGFTVIFTEVLTGKQISDKDEFQKIDKLFIQNGKTSLVHIAYKCFQICNEVDPELKMLKYLGG